MTSTVFSYFYWQAAGVRTAVVLCPAFCVLRPAAGWDTVLKSTSAVTITRQIISGQRFWGSHQVFDPGNHLRSSTLGTGVGVGSWLDWASAAA